MATKYRSPWSEDCMTGLDAIEVALTFIDEDLEGVDGAKRSCELELQHARQALDEASEDAFGAHVVKALQFFGAAKRLSEADF